MAVKFGGPLLNHQFDKWDKNPIKNRGTELGQYPLLIPNPNPNPAPQLGTFYKNFALTSCN